MKELIKIQSELKAPKAQFNAFGKYKYRKAEDVLEALKPLLSKYSCFVTLSDEIASINGRFYVKAVAAIKNEVGEVVAVSAFAREEESKKGMDGAQVTGAASSYARKYALNGLFAIDDTDDSDSMQQTTKKSVISDERLDKGIQSVISGSLPIKRFKESLKIIELTESQQAKVDEL